MKVETHGLAVPSGIIALLESVPAQAADVKVFRDSNGIVISVIPQRQGPCKFTLIMSDLGTSDFDIYFADGLRLQDLPTHSFDMLEIVSAIIKGEVCEELWTIGRVVVRAEGQITLTDGSKLFDTNTDFGILKRFANHRKIEFLPY